MLLRRLLAAAVLLLPALAFLPAGAREARSNSVGALYADWYSPSIGHDMCKPPGIAWTNAVVVVPPSYPAHPNLLGDQGAANAVLAAIGLTSSS